MRMVWKHKIRSCLLAGILLAGMMAIALPVQVYADAAVEDFWNTAYSVDYDVTVSAPDGGVNLRYGAGVKYDKILEGMIPNGTVLHISETAKADNGKEWGYTTYNGLKGWVFLGQTKVTSAAVTPADQAAPAQTEPAEEPAVQQPEQPETDPVADDVSQEGSSANEEEAAPTSTNSNIFTIAIIALVILAIIVAVVLLLARRRR